MDGRKDGGDSNEVKEHGGFICFILGIQYSRV